MFEARTEHFPEPVGPITRIEFMTGCISFTHRLHSIRRVRLAAAFCWCWSFLALSLGIDSELTL